MLSFTELLNPAPAQPTVPSSFRPRPAVPSLRISTAIEIPSRMDRSIVPKARTAKEASSMTKSKVRGHVAFPPYENLDPASLREIERFQVGSFGSISESCQHIPYNSGKKDFFEKTGRESFEVFRYVFKYPGHPTEYVVMWDYNVGLVRMTPFFKCCGYGKTVPAKMLGLNPGLKEITHSITGGSIAAQGYWMPYQCAKAVCATFCYPIAGALIPIFGPDFPSQCIPLNHSDFGRMVIDSHLVHEATREAEISRRMYSTTMTSTFHNATSYPRETSVPRPYTPEPRYPPPTRSRLVYDPLTGLDYDLEGGYHSAPNSVLSASPDHHSYMVTSRPSSSWNPVNPRPHSEIFDNAHISHPWLSAVPRDPSSQPHSPFSTSSLLKRRLEYDSDYGYEGSASPNSLSPGGVSSVPSPVRGFPPMELPKHKPNPEDSKAAMLLMNFCMQSQPPSSDPASTPPIGSLNMQSSEGDEHRSKRHQTSSL